MWKERILHLELLSSSSFSPLLPSIDKKGGRRQTCLSTWTLPPFFHLLHPSSILPLFPVQPPFSPSSDSIPLLPCEGECSGGCHLPWLQQQQSQTVMIVVNKTAGVQKMGHILKNNNNKIWVSNPSNEKGKWLENMIIIHQLLPLMHQSYTFSPCLQSQLHCGDSVMML